MASGDSSTSGKQPQEQQQVLSIRIVFLNKKWGSDEKNPFLTSY